MAKVVWQRLRWHYEEDDPYWESDHSDYYIEPYRIRRSDENPLGYLFEVQRWVADKGERNPAQRPWSPMTPEEREECLAELRGEYLRILERKPSVVERPNA